MIECRCVLSNSHRRIRTVMLSFGVCHADVIIMPIFCQSHKMMMSLSCRFSVKVTRWYHHDILPIQCRSVCSSHNSHHDTMPTCLSYQHNSMPICRHTVSVEFTRWCCHHDGEQEADLGIGSPPLRTRRACRKPHVGDGCLRTSATAAFACALGSVARWVRCARPVSKHF